MFLDNRDWSGGDYGSAVPACDPQPLVNVTSGGREPEQDSLTALEQGVVALSLFDHPSSIRPPRGVARLLGWIGGTNPPNQLANPRLEALRRYCILLRDTDGVLAVEENDRVRAAGFSEAALKAVAGLIALGGYR